MGDIIDFKDRKNKNMSDLDLELEALDKGEFSININADLKSLHGAMDFLWSEIYIGKKISNLFADDDGFIHYKSTWVNSLEGDVDYERSLKEHLRITREFINNEGIASKFIAFCDEEVKKSGCLKLLVLSDPKEKSPS